MLLTKDFVVINYPKTGSTYMRECIKRIYCEATFTNRLLRKDKVFHELHLPKIYGNKAKAYKDQHGVVSQIPKEYNNHPIVTVIRNPIKRVVSSFHYEWWKRHPMYELSKIEEIYPNYPDIDLMTFAKMLNHPELTPNNMLPNFADRLGYNTRLFLIFYSENPEASAERLISNQYNIKELIKPNIHFLKQENLKQDLMCYIQTNTSKDPQLIASVPDKNTGNYKDETTYPKEFTDYVLKMDQHLFKAFYPELLD